MSFTLTKLDITGVRLLLQWAENEGWNPGMNDADIFYETDPDAFYGYYDKGQLIGGGSIVSYQGKYGFMGLFIMDKDHRYSGIGAKLWNDRKGKLLSRLEPGACIGMDGVVAMQPFYHKGGFDLAFRDIRFELHSVDRKFNEHVHPARPEDVSAITEYDTMCFGYERANFVKLWLEQNRSITYKYCHDKTILGYATVRKTVIGYKIGPLFAESAVVAEHLLNFCLSSFDNEVYFIDVPDLNSEATELIYKYNGHKVFECGRMYCGDPPQLPIQKIYGISSLEFG